MVENEDKNIGRSGLLDLLIATLSEHEKKMDALSNRMNDLMNRTNKLFENLKVLLKDYEKPAGKEKDLKFVSSSVENLIYLKIKLDRPLEEVVKILEALKE